MGPKPTVGSDNPSFFYPFTKNILLTEIMENSVMSEEVKKRIMKEGYPLQRFCGKKLQSLGWTVDEEYPVEQAVPVSWNPYGLVEGELKQVRTSGDIRAIYQRPTKGFAICICISCKRQSKVDWSFMKAMFTENIHKLISGVKYSDGENIDDCIFDLSDGLDEKYPLCNIPTNLFNRNENTPREEDKIVKTSENLYLETLQTCEDYRSWLRDEAPYNQMIFIPIIVTAAQIHAYDVDETNFKIDNIDAIDIAEVNHLMYQHHLPRSMHRNLLIKNTTETTILKKFNLFVVNYQNFENFIKSLMKKFEDHPM